MTPKLVETVSDEQLKFTVSFCRWCYYCILNAGDTGCCALEFGECQPQCRNRQHKLIQHCSMLMSDYCTHAVKTEKGKLKCTRSKNELRLITKQARSKRKGN